MSTSPRRLDGAPRARQNVRGEKTRHPGDPDRAQKTADRRGNEVDEKRREEGKAQGRSHARARHRKERHGQKRSREQEIYDGERDEKNRKRGFVGRRFALGTLHHADHALDKASAARDARTHDEPIGENRRAARDVGEVSPGFTDDRRGLARNGRFVDGRDPRDHFAVAGNDVARKDENEVVSEKRHRVDDLMRHVGTELVGGVDDARGRALSKIAKRSRLRMRPPFGKGLGEVRKEDREPEPTRNREGEARGLLRKAEKACDAHGEREERPQPDEEHHRIGPLHLGVELHETLPQGVLDELFVEPCGETGKLHRRLL